MKTRPRSLYLSVILFILLAVIFGYWGYFAIDTLIQLPSLTGDLPLKIISSLYWFYLIGTLIWIGNAGLSSILAYGLFKRLNWAYTTALIFTTLVIAALTIMLIGFMVGLVKFQDMFSIIGIVTNIIALLIDLIIVFLITRPSMKLFFAKQ